VSEDFETFRALVFQEPELIGRLVAETDNAEFARLVSRLAAERGFAVSAEEVRQHLILGRQVWHQRRI
jgi:hypothetical protein